MKILYLAHRIPYPPDKGEKIRAFHQIKQLSRSHMIHLCSFMDDPGDISHVSTLKDYCATVEVIYRSNALTPFLATAALLKRSPLSVALFSRKALAKKILQKLTTERPDCIVVSSSSMAQYASAISSVPKVIDLVDVDSEKWRLYAQRRSFPSSLIYRLEAERLAKYEERIARIFDHTILISEEERRLFQKRVSGRSVSVISNGVDLDYFAPSDVNSPYTSQPIIVFIGVMDYFPNVDAVQYFCQEIFPFVHESVSDAQFYIVGRNPAREVKVLKNQPNVVVTGAVSDVRPYLAQARVAVAPFRLARGVQNKVLEAMSMGVPVVGTAEAFKGIAATEQDGIRITNDPRSFAQHVTDFLSGDVRLRHQVARQARRYVERHHQWHDQGAKLERLLEEVVWRDTEEKSLGVKSAARA